MKNRTPLMLLACSILAIGVGVQMHSAMNVNFLHDLLAASSWQQGYLEGLRETFGILSFLVIALLAGKSEPGIAVFMLAVVGTALAFYSRLTSISGVILLSAIWSFGFHAWVPLSSSMSLALSPRGREGQTLGFLGSVGSAGVLASLGGVYLLKVYGGLGMRELFVIAGVVTAIGAVPMLFMPQIRAEKPEVFPAAKLLAPRYRLYLGLELLDGMRKQVFILFAILALVQEHGVKVETIAVLMLANQVVNIFLAPAVGRMVDRIGERCSLSIYFTGLIALFLMYAWFRDIRALYAVYILDSAMWTLRVAIPTYANRIVQKGERTRLLAMGVSVNHIGAVTLPFIGGALYSAFGYRFPFYCGAAIALLSLCLSRKVPDR